MGRKKIVIKRLAEDRNRNVTFLKRKAGLMKKAWELSVLCGAEVSVIVFNSAGKLFEFSSASSVELAIDRYHSYAGPVERRKPEEFIAQQAAGGADNSDDDEEIAHQPVPSGSGAAAAAGATATAGGVNNGGAPITASGNMSLRGRDEWKEATVPSYAHVQGGMQDDDRIEGGMHHGSALDGGNMSGVGPVDPRLTERQPFGAGGGGHQSSFNHHHHHHHQAAEQQQQDHPSFRLSRESEEIMEQQRRAEQYRFLQMQTQMNGGGIPSGSSYGGGGGNDAAGLSAPSWMGMGRNRQRSDLFDGGLDAAGRGGGGGEQLTSWAAMRSGGGGGGGGARTPSITSNAAAAFPQSGPGGNQPSLNSLYASQRLDAHSAQGTTSPTRASMVSHGPSGGGGGGTGSDAMSRGGVSPASRHGLPAENISAGEFTGSNGNAGGAGLDFYTSYHLPPAHGVNADGTLDWQRTAAAAQLQAALQAQQAQLAYLRQQKAQQVQWQDLVAASGMDNAVHQLHSRLAASSNQQHGQEHGGGGGDSRGSVGLDYAGRYTPRGEQNTAPSTASFTWPGAAGGGANTNEATTGGSWYNTLQEPTHSSRTSDLRLPHPVSEDAGRGPSADQRGRALSYAIESEETSPVGAGVDEQEDGKDGRKRRMMEGDEDDEGLLLDGREGDARKRSRVASS